jgi:hypothetical protein
MDMIPTIYKTDKIGWRLLILSILQILKSCLTHQPKRLTSSSILVPTYSSRLYQFHGRNHTDAVAHAISTARSHHQTISHSPSPAPLLYQLTQQYHQDLIFLQRETTTHPSLYQHHETAGSALVSVCPKRKRLSLRIRFSRLPRAPGPQNWTRLPCRVSSVAGD